MSATGRSTRTQPNTAPKAEGGAARLAPAVRRLVRPVELEEPKMTYTALQHLVFLSGPSLQTYYPIARGQELCELLDGAWAK